MRNTNKDVLIVQTQGVKGGKWHSNRQGQVVIKVGKNATMLPTCNKITVDGYSGLGPNYQQRENALIDIDFASGATFTGTFDKLEQKILSPDFPNGFEDWMETHHEVVSFICDAEEVEGTTAYNRKETEGRGGIYELAKEWTNEFELKYKGIAWGEQIEYFDTLELFLNQKNQPAKFNNSILQSESNTFPPDIEAGIERSNNPHGYFELSVCANGDLLGTYYYDTREEAKRDLEALQARFNVTDL